MLLSRSMKVPVPRRRLARIVCRDSFRPRLEMLEDRTAPSATFLNRFVTPTVDSNPNHITLGPDGALFFTEMNSQKIGRISNTGTITESAGTGVASPAGITNGHDGFLYFTENSSTGLLGRIKPDLTGFSDASATYNDPQGIIAAPDGFLYFAETGNNSIDKIAKTNVFGTATKFALTGAPQELVIGPDGFIYFTEPAAGKIGKISTTGTGLVEASIPGATQPFGIAVGGDKHIWFTDTAGNRVGWVNTALTGGALFAMPAVGDAPVLITSAPDGKLYVAENGSDNNIAQVQLDGTITDVLVPGMTNVGVAVGSDGNLWFTQLNNDNVGTTFGQIGKIGLDHTVVVASGPGHESDIRLYTVDASNPTATPTLSSEFLAYDPSFTGGVQVAYGDLNGDGVPDIITAPATNSTPEVRVFDGVTHQKIKDFMAYATTFTGGLNVAVADVNGDGVLDIITAPGVTGGPEIKVFDGTKVSTGANSELLFDFFAYASTFTGGCNMSVGDINNDGKADIITGTGPTGGPEIKVFSGANSSLLFDFNAFEGSFRGGVVVSTGDWNGDGRVDIIGSRGPGGLPEVAVYNGINTAVIGDFFPYPNSFSGGVRVAGADLNGDGLWDIVTGAGAGSGAGPNQVKTFRGSNAAALSAWNAFDPAFLGGVYVGAVRIT
jgi:streptogramin lyase